ncbi:NADPH:quinone oxidoreductase family protein [Blastochloris viridis]|uniref:Mycocerosic acid synthase n=1 Tax=Blastochloris viridis TaxID=1079 RepID=A0A0H5BCV8_BLAVI|nr:NADPH:quinone oxidoreductase family protein [Blastochloris viridis]ALK11053.1 Mycocerosic acid synthase [Blastochloris viridis]BAR98959.1 quinone oxidoreductase [Blastochloris viridis]CUU43715.1 Mycocerosic acid synthase [Blastochloris viridis]
MKALLSTRVGPPDALELTDVAEPVAGPGEAVVEVRAVALNFFDTLIIQDRYQQRPPRPFAPGGECAGVVAAVGPGVTEVRPGDRVGAYLGWGCAQDKVVARAARLVRLPDQLSFERAAATIVTYGTTLHALEDRARLKPGETLAVLGASGGVGAAAIEIGKLMGARVIACASSAEKLAFCRALGADDGLDYTAQNLKAGLRALTRGAGVDVVYDAVGGPYSEPALRATAFAGRFLVIGFAAGDIARIPLNLVLLGGRDVLGVSLGGWAERHPDAFRAALSRLFGWAADGTLTVPIDATYPLAEAARALEAIATRRVRGKVVLTV